MTGWGAINFTVLPKSDVRWIYPSKLQYLRVRVMLRQKCANMYNFKNLKKEIICASANVKQATGFVIIFFLNLKIFLSSQFINTIPQVNL